MEGYYLSDITMERVLRKEKAVINEIGKIYEDEDDYKLFEIYTDLINVPVYQYPKVLFEIDTMFGAVEQDPETGRIFTSRIRLINLIEFSKVKEECTKRKDEMIASNNAQVRCNAVMYGWGIEQLKDDPDENVRAAIASKGFYLDQYKDDPSNWVRMTVAEQGKYLEKLKNDPNEYVRAVVAGKGAYLNELIEDPSAAVRVHVAEQIPLEDITIKLIRDSSVDVRAALAERGIALHEYVNDEDPVVRTIVAEKGEYINILLQDPDAEVRKTAIYYVLNVAINDPEINKDYLIKYLEVGKE